MKKYELSSNATHEDYLKAEAELIADFEQTLKAADLKCRDGNIGHVLESIGNIFEDLIITVDFGNDTIKKYQLKTAIASNFLNFTDLALAESYTTYYNIHKELTTCWLTRKEQLRIEAIEAEKKAKAEEKAEAAYQSRKAKAEKTFYNLIKNATTFENPTEEFYYSLGWLAKHIGSLTAVIPDYLEQAFEEHFGLDTPKILIDGRAKTSGGYSMHWSWEFRCTIKKLKETVVPSFIDTVTTDISKGIHNTSFLWDLVENYGFNFGKKQDLDRIESLVPVQYKTAFSDGLAA